MRKHIKIAIIEDQKATLDSLSILLNGSNSIQVTGAFSSGEDALEELPKIAPDVVLVDLGLPGITGIDVIAELKNVLPGTEILVLTGNEDKRQLFSALKAGASGYLLKESSPGEIVDAIKDIYDGGAPMSPKVARHVIEEFHQHSPFMLYEDGCALTKREKEVLKGICDGLTYKGLAERLFIEPHTIRTHIKNIYEKLHVHSKLEAVTKAREERLV